MVATKQANKAKSAEAQAGGTTRRVQAKENKRACKEEDNEDHDDDVEIVMVVEQKETGTKRRKRIKIETKEEEDDEPVKMPLKQRNRASPVTVQNVELEAAPEEKKVTAGRPRKNSESLFKRCVDVLVEVPSDAIDCWKRFLSHARC